VAKKIISEAADNMAFALSHVVHLFHPEIIVIGGGLSYLGDYLLSPVRASLPGYLLKSFHPGPEIKIASLGEKVVPLGAVELARTSIIELEKQTLMS
jgi:glucokinase